MQKALKALPLNPKLINVKPGNYFKGYVSNLTHNQKNTKQKQPLRLFEKEDTSFSKSRSLVFTFYLKIAMCSISFSALATTFFHIAGTRIDIRKLLLRSLVFDLL